MPCNYILDKFGTRIGCTIGGILVIAGSWARIFMKVDDPFWAIVGSVLCALGNIFVLSSPSSFAIKWFSSSETPKIISGTVLASMISNTVGGTLAGFMIPEGAD
jgi:MFS family permease